MGEDVGLLVLWRECLLSFLPGTCCADVKENVLELKIYASRKETIEIATETSLV